MSRFVVGNGYSMAQVRAALGGARSDGRFLFGRVGSAMLADIGDGRRACRFVTRSSLLSRGPVPARVVEDKALSLFVTPALTYAGEARVSSYSAAGKLPRDVSFVVDPPLPRDLWRALLGKRMPPPGPPPETALAALAADASPSQRWAALVSFLARWRRAPIAARRPRHASPGLPVVRATVRALAAIPNAFHFNELVAPGALATEGGRIPFLYENQGVCLWAAEPRGNDPRVWYRVNEDGAPWLEEPQRLSGFVIQAALFEAIWNAPFGAQAIGRDKTFTNAVVARLQPLVFGQWRWLSGRFYARDGALAMTTEGDGGVDLYLAAATPAALARFEDVVTDDWDHIAF